MDLIEFWSLKHIVTDGVSDESDPYSVWIRDGQINNMSKIDAFAMGRATKPRHYWDSLSMREFVDYLTTGILPYARDATIAPES